MGPGPPRMGRSGPTKPVRHAEYLRKHKRKPSCCRCIARFPNFDQKRRSGCGTPRNPPEPPRNPLGTPSEPPRNPRGTPAEPHQTKLARSMWSLSLLKLSSALCAPEALPPPLFVVAVPMSASPSCCSRSRAGVGPQRARRLRDLPVWLGPHSRARRRIAVEEAQIAQRRLHVLRHHRGRAAEVLLANDSFGSNTTAKKWPKLLSGTGKQTSAGQ